MYTFLSKSCHQCEEEYNLKWKLEGTQRSHNFVEHEKSDCIWNKVVEIVAHTQWCIAKNGVGYTQRGVAKGLKVPCLFMIVEVSTGVYAFKKTRRLVYAVYPLSPPNTPLPIPIFPVSCGNGILPIPNYSGMGIAPLTLILTLLNRTNTNSVIHLSEPNPVLCLALAKPSAVFVKLKLVSHIW